MLAAREGKKAQRAPTRERHRFTPACEETGERHHRGVEPNQSVGGRTKRQAVTTTGRAEREGKGKTWKVEHAVVTPPGVARGHHDHHNEEGVNRGADAGGSAGLLAVFLGQQEGKIEDSKNLLGLQFQLRRGEG